jgi:hypothetical protein
MGMSLTAPSFAQPAQSAPQPGLPPGAAIGTQNAPQPPASGRVTTTPMPGATPTAVMPAASAPVRVHHYYHHRVVHHYHHHVVHHVVTPAAPAPAAKQ